MTSQIIRDGSLAGGIPSIPEFRPVAREVFAERAARLRTLAPGHAIEEYLRFAAALSTAQDQALRTAPIASPSGGGPGRGWGGSPSPSGEGPGWGWGSLPDAQILHHCHTHGMPPLSAQGHPRDPAWRDLLAQILDLLDAEALPPQARVVLASLLQPDTDALESAANSLLAGAYDEVDPGQAPFVAAALQVYWVAMALALGNAAFSRGVEYGLCPVCGSRPLGSVVRVGGATQGLRYLVCSLCASEWHVVRVKCTACASTQGISLLGIEGADEAVRAECCDACHGYLKLFHSEKDTALEPAADDLATLALDLLVDEQGYNRTGPNLLFLPGAGI